MGSLLVLLVVMARQARLAHVDRVHAGTKQRSEKIANRHAVPPSDESPALPDQDDVEDYRRRLEEVQQQTRLRLVEEQNRLSHLEDHIRRLQQELDSVTRAMSEIELTKETHYVDYQQAENELARLKKLVEKSERDLEALQSELKNRPKSYLPQSPKKKPNKTFKKKPLKRPTNLVMADPIPSLPKNTSKNYILEKVMSKCLQNQL